MKSFLKFPSLLLIAIFFLVAPQYPEQTECAVIKYKKYRDVYLMRRQAKNRANIPPSPDFFREYKKADKEMNSMYLDFVKKWKGGTDWDMNFREWLKEHVSDK